MKHFAIENLVIPQETHMEQLPEKIFKKPGIALVAAGSYACVRTLYFQACRIGQIGRFFGATVSASDYTLGKQGRKIQTCLEQALASEGIKGIIIYASCMEVLTMWDFQTCLQQLDNPNGIPIELLYRGPLVKKKHPPAESLERIWQKWNLTETHSAPLFCAPPALISFQLPPFAPDFEGILSFLKEWDCDSLLFTAGGCKSCLGCSSVNWPCQRIKSTRFSDLMVCGGNTETICETIKKEFTGNRFLFLLGSAVPHATGMDLHSIAGHLCLSDKQTFYLESSGLQPAIPAMADAWLKLGRLFLSGRTNKTPDVIWILGYSSLTYPQKSLLDRQIQCLKATGLQAEIWQETPETVKQGRLPRSVWAVSAEGIPLALWMKTEFGLPCRIEALPDLEEPSMALPSRAADEPPLHILCTGEPLRAAETASRLSLQCPDAHVTTAVYAPDTKTREFYRKYLENFYIFTDPEQLLAEVAPDVFIGDPVYFPYLKIRRPGLLCISLPYPALGGYLPAHPV